MSVHAKSASAGNPATHSIVISAGPVAITGMVVSSKVGEVLDIGVELGIVKKSGSWFSYGETKLGQGRDAVKSLIQDNPELADELEAKIIQVIKES